MQFVATHNVTADDVARAARLGARSVDLLLSVIVVVVLIGILVQVLYSFALYLSAVAHAPEKLVGLLRFETGEMGVAALTWLSILVSVLLPVFLFYAIRSLADTLHPAWRVRRLPRRPTSTTPRFAARVAPSNGNTDSRGFAQRRNLDTFTIRDSIHGRPTRQYGRRSATKSRLRNNRRDQIRALREVKRRLTRPRPPKYCSKNWGAGRLGESGWAARDLL